MALKMSPEEKVYLDKLVAISGKDITQIRDVLRSILVLFSIESYSGETEIIIPYIGKLKFDLIDKCTPVRGSFTKVNLKAEACSSLVDELVAINDGEVTSTQDFFKANIFTSIKDILEIEEDSEILLWKTG